MRNLVELFKVLKANKKLFKDRACNGLCRLIKDLKTNQTITYDECDILLIYIDHHRPNKTSKYYDVNMNKSAWYWPLRSWHPRLLWINAQIRLLSKDELKAGTGKSTIIANKVKKSKSI